MYNYITVSGLRIITSAFQALIIIVTKYKLQVSGRHCKSQYEHCVNLMAY